MFYVFTRNVNGRRVTVASYPDLKPYQVSAIRRRLEKKYGVRIRITERDY